MTGWEPKIALGTIPLTPSETEGDSSLQYELEVWAQCLCHDTDLSIELLHVDSEQQPWPGWSLADYFIWMSNPFHFFPVWQSSGWCSLWPGFLQGCVNILGSSFICFWKRDKWAWWKSDVSLRQCTGVTTTTHQLRGRNSMAPGQRY